MNTGKEAAVDDVVSSAVNDGLLVAFVSVGLFGGDES